MYAVVQVGGRQYRARPGERMVVDRMAVAEGQAVELGDVRMLVAEPGDSLETAVGRPRVEGARVTATAVSHLRGPKVVVFKYKPKKRYRRTMGFRAELTELRIEEVLGPDQQPVRESRAPAARRSSRRAAPLAPEAAPEQAPEDVSAEVETPEVNPQAAGAAAAESKTAKAPRRRRAPASKAVSEVVSDGEGGGGDGS
ncbi:MAG: 50S ribosomal protein L21 [Candidatus Dormibacteraeota bacterium]|nr:50S ribosomal protein L21 [Candidatus Dormibacteraeota bacterium]